MIFSLAVTGLNSVAPVDHCSIVKDYYIVVIKMAMHMCILEKMPVGMFKVHLGKYVPENKWHSCSLTSRYT